MTTGSVLQFYLLPLPSILYTADFTQESYFHLAGIRQLIFDFLCYITSDLPGVGIVDRFGVHDDSDFPACLNGIGLFDPAKAGGDILQIFQSFDIAFQCFASCAGPAR